MTKNARFKSLFITPALGITALLAVVSFIMAAIGFGERLAWLGAGLASIPLPSLVAQLMYAPKARTSEFLPIHLLLMIIGLILAGRTMYADFVVS